VLELAAQGSGGVAIPGGVQKTCGHGTAGCVLAGMVGLGWRMDSMILEVFSNLNDSVTKCSTSPWFSTLFLHHAYDIMVQKYESKL